MEFLYRNYFPVGFKKITFWGGFNTAQWLELCVVPHFYEIIEQHGYLGAFLKNHSFQNKLNVSQVNTGMFACS